MSMNFTGVIDFTKYTLALAAAGFLYTLESFVPAPTAAGRAVVLVLMMLFLLAALSGVFIFAVSTAAMHDPAREPDARVKIKRLGIAHLALLTVGMVALGAMLVPKVLAAPEHPVASCPCMKTK